MKEKWRLLLTGFQWGPYNMALDEAVLNSVSEGKSPPTLRLYGWNPPCVTVGYFQSLAAEVDVRLCRQLGVDVVRRMTGGGAVYHKEEVTYSVHVPEAHPITPKNILESYRLICQGLTKGLTHLGINSEFAPLNDIITNGKKISGNAQTRRKNVLLQHGTVLLNVDVDEMFKVLLVPNEKQKGRVIQDVKQRVTSASEILKRDVKFDETQKALKKGFEEALHITLTEGSLTQQEKEETAELQAKYSSDAWNNKR
ncbi:Lipoate-protein ligase A subunit 1 [uncultured archaeon]|nr:Lipoate-protein ligase A subunit 1 [uncultured archaeon]